MECAGFGGGSMSSIGFMGVGLRGLRGSMCLDRRLSVLVACEIPSLPSSLTAMGLERVEEIGRIRPRRPLLLEEDGVTL